MLAFSVTFLITILNLAILVFVLKALLWKRLSGFLDERRIRIARELEESKSTKARAEELQARYEELLANAENESEWVVREAEDRGREEYERIVADAESEALSIRNRAEEAAQARRSRAADELAEEIAALAKAAALKAGGPGAEFDRRQARLCIAAMAEARGSKKRGPEMGNG